MKKLLITFATALLVSISAFAQNEDNDSWFEKDEYIYSSDAVTISSFDQLGFGFSQIKTDENYLDLEMGKSFSFYMDMVAMNVNLTQSGHLKLHSGIRLSVENYTDKKDLIFDSKTIPGTLAAYPSVQDIQKSKMKTVYFGVPVGLKYSIDGFKLYGNFIGELRAKSSAKVKYEDNTKDKNKLSGLEDLRASVECGVGYKDIALFYRYSLTPTFKKTAFGATNDHVMTVGVVIGI